MRAALAKLVGRKRPDQAPASEDLPPEVAIALGGASFLDRGLDGEGNRRLMVMPAGGGTAFVYDRASASQYLADRFGLNEAQIGRALSLLRGCLADFDRQHPSREAVNRNTWSSWRPVHDVSEL
ncbi:hypothetical protein [Burkholderia gladioli]|uniref:hypothetical protein n=1 Tax=Burkholderia gladioli TaxID=28095 RepID=UPI00163EDEC6|nr:hypothetical protein [Burkholderia gladioli]